MIFLFSLFWFIRETKSILFWLYLWQLKEYHIGRFIDHFRTEKGKRLIFNKLQFLKIILLFSFPPFYVKFLPWLKYHVNFWLVFLLILYFSEAIKGFYDLFKKKFKIPILTKKIFFLISVVLIFEFFYLFSISSFKIPKFSFYLLIFDIFTPAITSGFVLIFQPFAALIRDRVIEKAKKKREAFKNLIVIGITGSYGKTSTKEFLAEILSEKYKVLKTLEHQNSEIGISQCILNDLNENHQIFIVEMGAYNRGGIKLLCDIAKPKIGILCGANEQHLALFGSMENLISAEGGKELVDALPDDGLAIFNGSNPHTFRLYLKTKKPKKVYRFQAIADRIEPDIFAKDIEVFKDSIIFRVFTKKGEVEDFKVNLLGAQNVPNLLAAILVAKELGMSFVEIKKACQKIKPEQGGMKLIKTKDGLNIIDSTYSANPDGVIAHLEYLRIWPGKKVIVMPCLIELGHTSKEVHKRIGEKIGQVCDLAIIVTKDRFKEIKDGSISSPQGGAEILFLGNPKEIVEKIKNFTKPNDIVLLEGRVSKEVIGPFIK